MHKIYLGFVYTENNKNSDFDLHFVYLFKNYLMKEKIIRATT